MGSVRSVMCQKTIRIFSLHGRSISDIILGSVL